MNNGLREMNSGLRGTGDGKLPPVDFSDINDIEGSASLILSMSGATSLIPGASSPLATPAKAAREWVRGVRGNIGTMSAGDAMRAAGCLDLMHRLAYGRPEDGAILDRYRLAAFDSFVRGDRSVDRYTLFNVVSGEVSRRNRRFFGSPLRWESMCVDRWHSQFRHGASLEELPAHDTVRRVTALLGSDLWAFETKNEFRFKQTLFQNYKYFLEDLEGLDYPMLIADQALLTISAPYLSSGEYTACDTRIRKALIASPATNRFHREALRLSVTD